MLRRLRCNQKAASTATYVLLIGMALAVIGLIVLVLIAKGILPFQASKRTLCKTSNQWGTMFGGDIGTAINPFGSFCSATNVVINSKEWDKCNRAYENEFRLAGGDIKKQTAAAKKCAAQQVLELILDCYDMGGKGRWEPPSFMCYTFVIEGDVELDKAQDAMDKFKDEVEHKLVEYVREKTGGEFLDDAVVDAIVGAAEDKKLYEMVVSWHKDVIWSKIDGCRANDEIESLEVSEDVYAGVEELAIVLEGKIDNTKPNCGDVEVVVRKEMEDVAVWDAKIEAVDNELSRLLAEHQVPEEMLNAGEIIELSGAIDMFSFREGFLMDLAVAQKTLGSNKTYAAAMRTTDNFEIMDEVEVRQGDFYEIGYCNPPLKLGSGIGARFKCGYLTTSNQVVQVAVGGTGAGGQLRTGSPVPGYCHTFVALDNPLYSAPAEWCENIISLVTGPGE